MLNDLFKDYNNLSRPVLNDSDTVNVNMSIELESNIIFFILKCDTWGYFLYFVLVCVFKMQLIYALLILIMCVMEAPKKSDIFLMAVPHKRAFCWTPSI